MSDFNLTVITPLGKQYEGRVNALVFMADDGFMGILAGHEALVAALRAGAFKITDGKQEKLFTAGAGVLEVNKAHDVVVLTDSFSPLNEAHTLHV